MEMPLGIKQVLDTKITWQEVTPGGIEFIAIVQGHACRLRINDFPDEPLFTLTVGSNRFDLDDAPAGWKIPRS